MDKDSIWSRKQESDNIQNNFEESEVSKAGNFGAISYLWTLGVGSGLNQKFIYNGFILHKN